MKMPLPSSAQYVAVLLLRIRLMPKHPHIPSSIYVSYIYLLLDFSYNNVRYYEKLNDILNKRGIYQHGYGLSDEEALCQGIGIREGKETGHGTYDFLAPTTLYNEQKVEITIDGIRMKLVSAVGETDDQIFVWLEDFGVICTGDNYYGCWPNLYAIRGTQYRDIAQWVDSLGLILSYNPDVLLPGHTKPLIGKELIQKQVGTFRDAIEYVLLKTLDCMNQGLTISETVEQVKLPKEFQEKDFWGNFMEPLNGQ